jgi:hypothetical protein
VSVFESDDNIYWRYTVQIFEKLQFLRVTDLVDVVLNKLRSTHKIVENVFLVVVSRWSQQVFNIVKLADHLLEVHEEGRLTVVGKEG